MSRASTQRKARVEQLVLSAVEELSSDDAATTVDTPLYTAFCPMAFDNKGGQWIQSDKKVSNPYYGSMMLRCGSIKEKIAGSEGHSDHSGHGNMSMKKDDHSGHSH